jgi:capsid portal protein
MKLFGFNFGSKKVQASPITQLTDHSFGTYKNFAFSTPFYRISKDNLSLPYVARYYTTNNIVRFGEDNLYPQLLNQLYYTSPLHGSIIEFITNAIIGGGYTYKNDKLTSSEKIELMTFEKLNEFQKLLRLLTRDYLIHRRVCVKVVKRKGGFTKFFRLDPSTIRNELYNTKFIYSYDWSRGYIDFKEFNRWEPTVEDGETLYVYQDNTPGQDIYPIPQYNSILNYAALDGEIAYFHKNNIMNSVFPSLVIKRPKEFNSIEEIQAFKEEITSKTGAHNAGRVLVLTGNGKDDVPELDSIKVSENDKMFETVSKEIKDQLCFAWSLNPSIMGIKVAGSLGNAEELQMSYAIFEKNVVMPYRRELTEIFNQLLFIANQKNEVEINNYQILDKTIVPTKETIEKKI